MRPRGTSGAFQSSVRGPQVAPQSLARRVFCPNRHWKSRRCSMLPSIRAGHRAADCTGSGQAAGRAPSKPACLAPARCKCSVVAAPGGRTKGPDPGVMPATSHWVPCGAKAPARLHAAAGHVLVKILGCVNGAPETAGRGGYNGESPKRHRSVFQHCRVRHRDRARSRELAWLI
jgi:hypothetical protein